jgi:hypothetical protein
MINFCVYNDREQIENIQQNSLQNKESFFESFPLKS